MVDIKLKEIDDNSLVQTDELNILLEQLQLLFFTKKHDVLGECDFYFDLEKYLWEFKLNNTEIERILNTKIRKYILFSKHYKITTRFKYLPGQITDTGFVDVVINGVPVLGIHITR